MMKIYDFKGKKNLCGDRLRQARALRKMTQSDLAAKLQIEDVLVERNSISKIESGERFVADYELAAFAKILNVSMEWLTTEDEKI